MYLSFTSQLPFSSSPHIFILKTLEYPRLERNIDSRPEDKAIKKPTIKGIFSKSKIISILKILKTHILKIICSFPCLDEEIQERKSSRELADDEFNRNYYRTIRNRERWDEIDEEVKEINRPTFNRRERYDRYRHSDRERGNY